jgi:5-methylcytosine-specific restriction endonuclease McrA
MIHTLHKDGKTIEIPVYQYEYHDWLITIKKFYDTDKYQGFAQPSKYQHLYDIDTDDIEEVLIDNGIISENYDDESFDRTKPGNVFYFKVDPMDDTMCFLQGVDLTSPASMLEYLVREVYDYKRNGSVNKDIYENFMVENRHIVVLRQIHNKSSYPKSSKHRRGFMQVAWSAMVRARDKKCTECSSVFDLHAHHIQSYATNEDLRYDVNNGITLCGVCHRKLHKEEGRELSKDL